MPEDIGSSVGGHGLKQSDGALARLRLDQRCGILKPRLVEHFGGTLQGQCQEHG